MIASGRKPRIAIAGFMHESNTFSPLRTDMSAFKAQSVTWGPSMIAEWRDAHHEVGGYIEAAGIEGWVAGADALRLTRRI